MISRGLLAQLGLVCFALVAATGALRAATITLLPVADTTLFQTDPDNNVGGDPTFISGTTASGFTNRALLKFDIAGHIPSNALIEVVTLTLTVTRTSAGLNDLFRLQPMLVNWTEGTGTSANPGSPGGKTGAPALPGETTWRARFFPNTLWTVAGGAAGADYAPSASATQTVSAAGHYTFSSSNLVMDARNWLTNASNNFGWILICDNEGTAATSRRIGSREDPLNTPRLDLQYVTPPIIQRTEVVGGEFRLTFLAETNQAYVVQARETLGPGPWVTLTNFPPPKVPQSIVVAVPATGPKRCFQVGAQ